MLCTILAIYVPCFGDVISLLGCFTVSILSFVMPPLLHYKIVSIPLSHKKDHVMVEFANDAVNPKVQIVFDVILTILGIFISVAGTCINGASVYEKIVKGVC